MRFNVAKLIKGPPGESRKYELHEEIAPFDPDVQLLRPLSGKVSLVRTSQGILVMGKLQTELRSECRRCSEPYDGEVEIILEEEFLPTVRIGGSPVDDVPDEARDEALLIDADHILDLSEAIRQELCLAVPTDGLCRPDCAGLCPECGGNRNLGECECESVSIDPRWAALQDLLSDEPDSVE
jgi:uncharacterized protein